MYLLFQDDIEPLAGYRVTSNRDYAFCLPVSFTQELLMCCLVRRANSILAYRFEIWFSISIYIDKAKKYGSLGSYIEPISIEWRC